MRDWRWVLVGMVLMGWGMPAGVVAQSIDELFQQGNTAQEAGHFSEAERFWNQVLRQEPNNAGAYNNLGNALRGQGKLEEAIAAYRQAIHQIGTYHQTIYQTNDYHQAIRIDQNAAVYTNLGNALRVHGKVEEAIAVYRQAIQLSPTYPPARTGLTYTLSAQRELEEAIAANTPLFQFESFNVNVVLIEPIEPVPMTGSAVNENDRGNVLIAEGHLEEAIASYHQALSLPDAERTPATAHILAHNGLGYALQLQGKLPEAIESYQRSIALDPNFSTAQNNLREAQRLLFLQRSPQPNRIDETAFLPRTTEEPLLPVLRSTARIISTQSDGFSIGTGWVVKREGDTVWVVTNRHVISDDQTQRPSTQIEIEFFSNLPDTQRPRYTATIEKITAPNEEPDLAVLKISGIPADILPLPVNLGTIRRNANIRVIGHPNNVADSDWTSTTGEVINFSPSNPKISIDVSMAEGNSGGPVINDRGEVIGMVVQVRTDRDIYTDPNEPTPEVGNGTVATRGVGLAYRVAVLVERLKVWGVLN
jgi:protein O-GlcNAc transferase